MVPAVDDRLLDQTAASHAENTWLYSGVIAGVNSPTLIRTLAGGAAITKTYRIPTGFLDADHLAQATWLEFTDTDTDVLRTQVVGDTFDRYYWVAPTTQATYNTQTRIAAGNTGGNAPFLLGIPTPGIAPVVTITGGSSAINRTSSYVYTWVSAYGEEGPPSPPTVATGKVDANWAIKLASAVGTDLGTTRNLTKVRIYRTVTGANGIAAYFLVQEMVIGLTENGNTHTSVTIDNLASTTSILAGFYVTGSGVPANDRVLVVASGVAVTLVTTTSTSLTGTPITFIPGYDDVLTDSVVALNNTLTSTNYTAPPTDLKGWVSLPNGIVAGFRENEIWFCEPYRLHAWPATYALAVDYPITGLGVIGQSVVVCTQVYPWAITGVHPATMTQAKIMNLEPCAARGSILSTPEGVYYASPNGLVLVANGSATNITKDLVTKDKWQQLITSATLSTLRAARLGTAYYAYGTSRPGVFEPTAFDTASFDQVDQTGALNGVLIDPVNQRVAFSTLSNSVPCVNVFNDPWTGELLVIRAGVLYWVNIYDSNPTSDVFKWRSKIFQASMKKNFEAIKIYYDTLASTPVQGARNTSSPQTLASNQHGLVRIYADDVLVMTRELRTSGELMRLPSGFKAEYWQVEIEARVRIKSLQLADTAKDLATT